MPKPVEGQSPYNPGLDGLRAVAVLGVVAYHLGLGWAPGGLLGVDVFFVLSGYLITDLLMAEYRRRTTVSLRRFWTRRARRLLPALFVMLVATVAWATLFDRAQLPSMRTDMLPAAFYYSNWWDIFDHLSYFARFGPPSAFSHLWSLAVEEQFYLLWPLLLLAGLRFVRRRGVLVAAVAVAAVGSAVEMALLYNPLTDPTRVYDGTDTRAFALLIGALLAFAWPRERRFAPVSRGARRLLEGAGIGGVVGICVFYWQVGQFDSFAYRGGMVLLSVCTAVVVAVCVHPGARLGRILGVVPLRWVGERSYGIYLWQLPVIVLTTPSDGARPWWRDLLQVVVIFAVSAASWRFVEEPVRHGALGRLWQRGREQLGRRQWTALRPGGRGLAALGVTGMACVVCVLGLSGVVRGVATADGPTRSILPPAHRLRRVTAAPPSGPFAVMPPGAPPASTTTTDPPPPGQGVTAIGDSVMVDVAPYLQQMLPGIVIDAQVGAQLTQVQSEVPQLKSAGDVGNVLVVELGTNGYYSVTQLEQLLRTLGAKRVVLVNTRETRPWEQAVNQVIATVAHTWPGGTLVDWYDASATQPQWFYPDGVHLNPTGAQAYARMIVQALDTPAPSSSTTTSPAASSAATPERSSARTAAYRSASTGRAPGSAGSRTRG